MVYGFRFIGTGATNKNGVSLGFYYCVAVTTAVKYWIECGNRNLFKVGAVCKGIHVGVILTGLLISVTYAYIFYGPRYGDGFKTYAIRESIVANPLYELGITIDFNPLK